MKSPCVYEFSPGNGTGVAEAIGNWGFSNCTSSGNSGGIRKLKCIFSEMDKLRSSKPERRFLYNRRNDCDAWPVGPSPHECKPSWTFPEKRPLITFSQTAEIVNVSSLKNVKKDMAHPIPGRTYLVDKSCTLKWYRADPSICCIKPNCCGTCS